MNSLYNHMVIGMIFIEHINIFKQFKKDKIHNEEIGSPRLRLFFNRISFLWELMKK